MKVSELVSSNIADAIINFRTWGSVIYNVSDAGDGIANDSAAISTAIAAAAVSGGIVFFKAGTYITDGQNVPANVTLWFANGAKLSVNTSTTVTINGCIEAGLYQIFSGLGTVAGTPLNSMVQASWFGVPTTTTSNGSVLLQKAIDFCQLAALPLMLAPNAKIRFDTPVVIYHGTPDGVAASKGLTLHCNNAIIYPNFNGIALKVQPLCTTANKGNGWGIANVNIYDLTFDNYFGTLNGYASSVALKIGRAGYSLDGYVNNVFENILVSGFATYPLIIEGARKITFNRVVARGTGLNITNTTLGDFVGDSDFNQCEFGGNNTIKPLYVGAFSASGSPLPEIRGLRFNDCVFYGSGSRVEASTNAKVGDVWFNDCAWDVGTSAEIALTLYANGTSSLSQVFVDSPYMVNYTGNAILAQSDGAANFEHLHIMNGHFGLIDAAGTEGGIKLVSLEQANVQGNTFTNVTGTNLIDVLGCAFVAVKDNIGKGNTATYIVGIDNSTTDFMVTGNIGKGGVNDLSGAVNKLVTNNLTTVT